MEYFRSDHPPDRLILCHLSKCEEIADYLEVNEQGRENSSALPTPAVKGMLQFCQRAYPMPNPTAAELLPKPALHRYC
jgi:hypothetical protein